MADVISSYVVPPERLQVIESWLEKHTSDIGLVSDMLAGEAEKRAVALNEKEDDIDVSELETPILDIVPRVPDDEYQFAEVSRNSLRENVTRIFENIIHDGRIRVSILWPLLELLAYSSSFHQSILELYESLKSSIESVLGGTIFEKERLLGKSKLELESLGLLKRKNSIYRDVPSEAIVTATEGKGILAFVPHDKNGYHAMIDFSYIFDHKTPIQELVQSGIHSHQRKLSNTILKVQLF